MKLSKVRSFILISSFVALPPAAVAQQKPTTAQAQQMLQNPAMLEQLKQRILSSGLTPDQVRARLRAEGYPENLLDAYLPGGAAADADSAGNTEDVFAAVTQLGIVDTTEANLLRCGVNPEDLQLSDSAHAIDAASTRRQVEIARKNALAKCLAEKDSVSLVKVKRGADADSGLTIFGLDFFKQGTSQFDANLAGPVDANYRIGPGDRLVLVLTGDVEQSYALDVTREGFVVIPQVGQLWVNNITLGELENVLYNRLGRVYSGVRRGPGATTHFFVTAGRLRSNQIFVVGDVTNPGSYRVASTGTALTALYAARGPTENGSMRQIEIRRGGGRVDVLDVYDYLLKGDASHDVRLENGDRVFVPIHGARVRIVGEVARPATYEMRKGETLADALRFAGGFTATAARRRVQIERILPPAERGVAGRDRVVTDIIADEFTAGSGPEVSVQPGDVIRVFQVATRVRNRIAVSGDVWAPGPQGITPGMRISDALKLAGGVKPDAYLEQLLITRLRPDSTRIELRAALLDTTGAVINDFPVKEDDEIRVFSKTEFRPTRYVAITGAVRKSGQFPYREGMTIRDLVLLAGGLEQSAYLNEAEVARLPLDRSRGQTATTFRVPLDSSYIFERGHAGRYLGPPGLPAPNGPHPEVMVEPYDNVLILRQPNWELQRTATLTGEIRYPGSYSLRTKTERLSDLIARAGGLTPDSYPNGVVFYRRTNSVGRIGIDLDHVLRDPRFIDNLSLQNGDSIFIPRYNAVVNVTGAVNSPVAVIYTRGKKVDYYIRRAGGLARNADLKRAYVTQPNGKVDSRKSSFFLFPDHNPEPAAGSTVYVPTKAPSIALDPLAAAGYVAQLLGTVITIIAVIRR